MKKNYFLIFCALAASACTVSSPSVPSTAAEQVRQQQVPGFYRHQVGDLTVHALFDGIVYVPREQMQGIASARVDDLVKQHTAPSTKKGWIRR